MDKYQCLHIFTCRTTTSVMYRSVCSSWLYGWSTYLGDFTGRFYDNNVCTYAQLCNLGRHTVL